MIVIAGPTASGKSGAAIALAKRIGGAVISGDSMQCYKGMDIGTAKVTPAEQEGVPHALIDCIEPDEPWNVVTFTKMAGDAAEGFLKQGLLPILAGGTGFYIRALLYGTEFEDTAEDTGFRRKMEAYAEENGAHALHQLLQEKDPASAARIHENNLKRVIRALEYYEQTGERISDHNDTEKAKPMQYDAVKFLLVPDRHRLYASIDRRVDDMMEAGLLEEVKALKAKGLTRDQQAMQGIGYKEILDHLDGLSTLEEAVTRIKTSSRHYAKRQLTWFLAEEGWIRIDPYTYDGADKIAAFMENEILSHYGGRNGWNAKN